MKNNDRRQTASRQGKWRALERCGSQGRGKRERPADRFTPQVSELSRETFKDCTTRCIANASVDRNGKLMYNPSGTNMCTRPFLHHSRFIAFSLGTSSLPSRPIINALPITVCMTE